VPDNTGPGGGAAASPQESQQSSPALTRPSDEEYNEALRKQLDSEGDQGGEPPKPTPVQGFWYRLLHGVKGKSRLEELARSVPRGVANAATNATQALYDTANEFVDLSILKHPLPIGAMGPVPTGAPDARTHEEGKILSNEDINLAYGNRSDDPLASFAEGATQVITGLAAARGMGVTNVIAQGAVVDAGFFDPYEAALSELAARAPNWTGIGIVGKLLTVKGDDSAMVARLKRATEGVVTGKIVDGLVAAARWIRHGKEAAAKAGTAAEVLDATAKADEAGKVLENVANDSHVSGDAVNVKANDNGTFTLQSDIIDRGAPTPAQMAAREEAAVKNGGPTGPGMGRPAAEYDQAPVFAARGEAEAQAAVLNDATKAHQAAGTPFTAEQSAEHFAFAKQLATSANPDDIARLATGTHFNLSYASSPKEVLAQIESISEQFRSALNGAQGKPGVPVEESIRIAREAIGGMMEREAPAIIREKLKSTVDLHAWLLAGDMVMKDMGSKLAKMSEVLDARPHDLIAHEEARLALDNFYGLVHDLAGANSEVGRALRILQERANPKATADLAFKAEKTAAEEIHPIKNAPPAPKAETPPVTPLGVEKAGAEDIKLRSKMKGNGVVSSTADQGAPLVTAGMTHRQIAAQLRMIRMAGGQPQNAFAVAHAAQTIKNTGLGSKVFEVFANFLLSGPRTVQTILTSGAGLNVFEPLVKMTAGVATGNRALAREGADIMWGNFKYVGENIRATMASLRAGRSLINPQPQHMAIGGLSGDIIRVPGRVAGAADEFSRVTAYRAYVRAKSLRIARGQGLTGLALDQRVAQDLRAAFDPATGIATIPEALKYAEVSTMSAPLGRQTLGGGFQTFVNNHLEAKFIAPFVKSSVNIFRYVHKSTPVLNLMSEEVRQTLRRGGEEAAQIHARTALAGSIYGFGVYQAMGGNLTGKGPSDPDLRALWLKNHQPYSLKIGDSWYSYARLDPLAMPLGLIGDLHTVMHELGDKGTEAVDLAYSTVAAMFYNMSSKSYVQGITSFADAWASNDPHATMRWIHNFAGSLGVPQLVASVNPDNVYRDVRSTMDAVISRIPGWSNTLDPRFDMFGDPTLKTPGIVNRNLVVTSKAAGRSVEDDLLEIGKGLSPLNPKIEGGAIDLKDKTAFSNGSNSSPYLRMMALLRNPADGSPSLRKAMTDLVRSQDWKDASDGTALYPGGKRWIMAAAIKEKYEQRALKQTMEEFPKLREAIRQIRRIKGAAISGGELGVREVESLFGASK
jgi:hypothetical protein